MWLCIECALSQVSKRVQVQWVALMDMRLSSIREIWDDVGNVTTENMVLRGLNDDADQIRSDQMSRPG